MSVRPPDRGIADNAARDIDAALAGVAEAPVLLLDMSEAASLGGLGIAYLIRLRPGCPRWEARFFCTPCPNPWPRNWPSAT